MLLNHETNGWFTLCRQVFTVLMSPPREQSLTPAAPCRQLVLVAVIGAVLAQEEPERVRSGLQDVAILNEKRSHDVSGNYDFGFAAEDGTARVEEKSDDGEVRGQYQYVDADGETVVVKYTAGKNGFVVDSPILPKAPKALPTLPPPPPQRQYQPQYQPQQQFRPQPPPFQQPQPQFQQQQFRPQPPPFQQPQPQYQQSQPQFQPQFHQQQPQFQPQFQQQQQRFQPPPQFQPQQHQFSQGPGRFVPRGGPAAAPAGPPAARFPAGVDPRACPNFPICPNQ